MLLFFLSSPAFLPFCYFLDICFQPIILRLTEWLVEGSTVSIHKDTTREETEWLRFITKLKNGWPKIHNKQLLSEEEQAGQPRGADHQLINCFASNPHRIFSYCAPKTVAAYE